MSEKENETLDETTGSTSRSHESVDRDPLDSAVELISDKVPAGVDRRKFLMRSAVIGAAAVMTGRLVSAQERTLKAVSESLPVLPIQAAPSVPLDKNLNVVKKGAGPVMTVIDEFYKVGPGPSSSPPLGSIDSVEPEPAPPST